MDKMVDAGFWASVNPSREQLAAYYEYLDAVDEFTSPIKNYPALKKSMRFLIELLIGVDQRFNRNLGRRYLAKFFIIWWSVCWHVLKAKAFLLIANFFFFSPAIKGKSRDAYAINFLGQEYRSVSIRGKPINVINFCKIEKWSSEYVLCAKLRHLGLLTFLLVSLVIVILISEKIFGKKPSAWTLLHGVKRKLFKVTNRQVVKGILAKKKLLKEHNIKIIINTGDAAPSMNMLSKAANLAGSITVSVTHGFVSDEYACSIVPTSADYLVTWTAQQARTLSQYLAAFSAHSYHKKTKILPFDIFKDDKRFQKNKCWRKDCKPVVLIGFGGTYFEKRLMSRDFADLFSHFCDLVSLSSSKVVYSLHPHDPRNGKLAGAFKKFGWQSIERYNRAEPCFVDIVIGATSSFMIESRRKGIPTIEILEFQRSNQLQDGSGTTASIMHVTKIIKELTESPLTAKEKYPKSISLGNSGYDLFFEN